MICELLENSGLEQEEHMDESHTSNSEHFNSTLNEDSISDSVGTDDEFRNTNKNPQKEKSKEVVETKDPVNASIFVAQYHLPISIPHTTIQTSIHSEEVSELVTVSNGHNWDAVNGFDNSASNQSCKNNQTISEIYKLHKGEITI